MTAALYFAFLASSLAPQSSDTLVITDVSVLPMDRLRILPHQTIVIGGGRIARMGPASQVQVGAGARMVDGRGKYLLPGLADMHVHLTSADELPRYLGYGVLVVRDLNGSPEVLGWRKAIAAGTLAGPRLIVSGPMLAGREIPWRNKVTPANGAEARAAVEAQKAAGYDQIKIYDGISKEVFDAAIARASELGMLSSGHIPEAVGFAGVLASRMTGLEHLDKTVWSVFRHQLDTSRIGAIADSIKRAGKWVTPTLESMIQLAKVGSGRFDSLMSRSEAVAAPREVREFWTTVTGRIAGNRVLPAGTKYGAWTDFQLRLAGALARAGVPLLAGTDTPNAVLVPGHSLHDELDALVEAGLTRFEALTTATSNPARFLGQEADWGLVAPSRRADLLLVEANPLEDLATLRDPLGAIIAGRWVDRAGLLRLRSGQP